MLAQNPDTVRTAAEVSTTAMKISNSMEALETRLCIEDARK